MFRHCYGTWMNSMESPKNIVSIQRRLAPSNPMTSIENLTTNVICNKCIIHNYSHHGIKWVVLAFGKYVVGQLSQIQTCPSNLN